MIADALQPFRDRLQRAIAQKWTIGRADLKEWLADLDAVLAALQGAQEPPKDRWDELPDNPVARAPHPERTVMPSAPTSRTNMESSSSQHDHGDSALAGAQHPAENTAHPEMTELVKEDMIARDREWREAAVHHGHAAPDLAPTEARVPHEPPAVTEAIDNIVSWCGAIDDGAIQFRALCMKLVHAVREARPAPPLDLVEHLKRQAEWSARTFGPGRLLGVVDHIRKELREIEQEPTDLKGWIDVAILALDGAWQAKNEAREWPDWRTLPNDVAIEHVKERPAPPLDRSKVADLLAYGRMQAHGFLVKQDKEQYQFWQGWNEALERFAERDDPPAAAPQADKE